MKKKMTLNRKGENNPAAKLRGWEVLNLRYRFKEWCNVQAELLHVSPKHVVAIITRRKWEESKSGSDVEPLDNGGASGYTVEGSGEGDNIQIGDKIDVLKQRGKNNICTCNHNERIHAKHGCLYNKCRCMKFVLAQ